MDDELATICTDRNNTGKEVKKKFRKLYYYKDSFPLSISHFFGDPKEYFCSFSGFLCFFVLFFDVFCSGFYVFLLGFLCVIFFSIRR